MQFSDLESAKPNVCQLFNVVSLREERSLSRDSSTKHPSPGRPVDPELRDRRSAEILQVAARLFAEHGYTNTNIQSIADHLQISKGLVYRYFASKEKLFAACLEDAVNRLNETIQSSVDPSHTPLAKLSQAVLSYLIFFHDNSEVVELFIQERVFFRDHTHSTYFAHREANMEPWRELLTDLAQKGEIQDLPAEQILDHIADLLYGIIFTDRINGRRQQPEERHVQIMNILFQGLIK